MSIRDLSLNDAYEKAIEIYIDIPLAKIQVKLSRLNASQLAQVFNRTKEYDAETRYGAIAILQRDYAIFEDIREWFEENHNIPRHAWWPTRDWK